MRVIIAVLSVFMFAQGQDMVNLSSIKDKEMIRCLSGYIKENKTHVRMIIDQDGKKELQIPKEYVDHCKDALSR
ncbi:hypothetical protein [Persephonella sp.]|uniref:hypothetical protein n=1 Tax=Persephonella sp. TaxID=2060922 RepID=UPI0025E84A1B|nr:hypothetical protein [Persephonella sp.]